MHSGSEARGSVQSPLLAAAQMVVFYGQSARTVNTHKMCMHACACMCVRERVTEALMLTKLARISSPWTQAAGL